MVQRIVEDSLYGRKKIECTDESEKAEQSVDTTLSAFTYADKDMNNETVERIFDANDEQLHAVLAFIEEGLEQHDASLKATMAITVAVEEMFVNVAHYAYEGGTGTVKIGMRFDGEDVIISLTDSGMAFNPLAKQDPNVKLSAEEREIGGLGIYMVKNSMDDCTYERRDNMNIFTMRKAIR